jgi:hypothetical protein
MNTKLIQLEDGSLVEVEVLADQVQPISGGFAQKVDATFDRIQPLLIKTCRPIVAAWTELNQEMCIERAEVEIGLSFESEGNVYIAKSKAGANLKIKLILVPKKE